jgi:hypothetical protein
LTTRTFWEGTETSQKIAAKISLGIHAKSEEFVAKIKLKIELKLKKITKFVN